MSEERLAGRDRRAEFDEDGAAEAPPSAAADEPSLPSLAPVVLEQVPGVVALSPIGRIAQRRQRLSRRWLAASPNLRGSAYMLAALLAYGVMVGAMKHVGIAVPLVEIMMIRQIIMSLIVALIAGRALPALLRTTRPVMQVSRGLITLAAMMCGFLAVIHIPLAQATALGFSQVFFVTIAAVLVLKERVDARRWTATIIGFCGVAIMLDPSSQGLNIYALASIAGALFGAGVTVSVRMMAGTERTETILLWQGLVLMAVLAVPCLMWWTPPSAEQWFWLVVLSLFGTAGQWLITRAYQVGEAAALAPLDFSRLLLSCFTGFVFFAEVPALTTGIGAAIVIGATLYTIRKNARPAATP